MATATFGLVVEIILTFFSLFLVYFIVRRSKATNAKKLFYFDIIRYAIRIFIVTLLVMPVLRNISPLIINKQNISLPPPGLATVEQWVTWWLGMPLTEFNQVDGVALFDLSAVVRGQSIGAGIYLMYGGMLVILALDFLMAYKNSKYARTIRAVWYGITLFGFIVWTLFAAFMNLSTPGAQDYRNRWLFMQYWQFTPWVVVLIIFETFFSFWLPIIVIGYLIYKDWKE